MAVTRLAWRPRQHTWAPHVRVHESGVHGPVQKLLVEQDAVDVLEQDAVDVLLCGSTQKKRLFGPGDESAFLIIVLHTSSVLVTVRASKEKKPKLIQTGKSSWPLSRNSRGLLQDPGCFSPKLKVEMKKPGPVIISLPHGILLLTFGRCDLVLQECLMHNKLLHLDCVESSVHGRHDLARIDHGFLSSPSFCISFSIYGPEGILCFSGSFPYLWP